MRIVVRSSYRCPPPAGGHGLSKLEVWPLVEAAVKEMTDDLSGPLLEQLAEIEARLAARPLNSRAAAAQP